MKHKIAIMAGGDTSEHDVSLRSAQGVVSFIDKERYEPYLVEVRGADWAVVGADGSRRPVDRNDFSFTDASGQKVVFQFAYIIVHGTPGEDGLLQGYLDMLGVPYSCCGVLASALTYDKFACNQYLHAFGVTIADSVLLREGQTIDNSVVERKIGLPCFIKPSKGGSSFGVTKVKTADQIQPAIAKARKEADEVVIEAFLQGMELTCGCYKTRGKAVAFPVTEVVPKNEFFDYDAKYNGQVEEITPARIPDELSDRIRQITLAVYDIIGAAGIIRVDYIVTHNGTRIHLLEVNAIPGMTATSFIPQQVRAAGLDITGVLTEIIEDRLNRQAI